jgi:hypothetical protein
LESSEIKCIHFVAVGFLLLSNWIALCFGSIAVL